MLYFDLHIHTHYSYDGSLSPHQVMKLAAKQGLNVIAITDHETITGGLKTKELENNELTVIIGSEIRTDLGEIIGLFLNEKIISNKFYEVIDEIRDQDGLIFLPHPFRQRNVVPKSMLKYIDVIEGINGRCSRKTNVQSINLARKHNIPMMAGSDTHFSFELGRVWNVTGKKSIYTDEEIKKIITGTQINMYYKPNFILRNMSIVLGTILKTMRNI